ncbi:hypothetical protein CY34DRAFT_809726 [Suillus luteus UH-Slu-Lm8-n1]|uniref:Uncharacterized protein n=1 Tax=Suillus luteus UH-Slu-Lm8-n1 TaxID=930992 RepID=A0A0D0AIZ2_9AGAM|nr:hypothetical protein CY34DRAFT_809726 [Suillus luteus UH-Slu-Lm8-n1]
MNVSNRSELRPGIELPETNARRRYIQQVVLCANGHLEIWPRKSPTSLNLGKRVKFVVSQR